jgi:hypothetical protein
MDYSVPSPAPAPAKTPVIPPAATEKRGALLAKRYRNGEKLTTEEMQCLHAYVWMAAKIINANY